MAANKPNPTTVRLDQLHLDRIDRIVTRTGKTQHAVLLDIVKAGLCEIEEGRYNPYAPLYPLTEVAALRVAEKPKKSANQ